MKLDFEGFLKTLPIMGIGMCGVFTVTIIIILMVTIMNYISKRKLYQHKKRDDI